MDFGAFQTKIATFERFPEPLRAYACTAADSLNDTERATLMSTLEKQYALFLQEQESSTRGHREMADTLARFLKTDVHPLQKALEAAEQDSASTVFDAS